MPPRREKFKFFWKGESYEVDSPGDLPKEILEAVFPYSGRDPSLCSFGDWKCPRPNLMHKCGGIPQGKEPERDKGYPFWNVVSYFEEAERKPFPGQQLNYFAKLVTPVTGWIARYYCTRGAAWAEENEKQIGAMKVIVEKVSKRKRKLRRTIVNLKNVLLLGSCKE